MRFVGQGMTRGEVTGRGVEVVGQIGEIGQKDIGRVVVMYLPTLAMIIKAEVVGIAGIVVGYGGEVDWQGRLSLPIVMMEEAVIKKLMEVRDIGSRQIQINANTGEVLVI